MYEPLHVRISDSHRIFVTTSLLETILYRGILFHKRINSFLGIMNKKQILDKGNFFPSPFAAMNTQLLFHGSEHLEMLVQQLLVCGQLGIGRLRSRITYQHVCFSPSEVAIFWI